jgi:hypothetical protein
MKKKDSIHHEAEDFALSAEARVEIRFRPGDRASVRRSLGLLAKCALEVLVKARAADGTHAPAQIASRNV